MKAFVRLSWYLMIMLYTPWRSSFFNQTVHGLFCSSSMSWVDYM